MNYIISEEMLETFENSLRLNKKHAEFIIEDAEQSGYVLSKGEQRIVDRQKGIIKNVDIVLQELEQIKKSNKEVIK